MSFDLQESSRDGGEPVKLFLIRYGSAAANFYAYTDHDQAIEWPNGRVFQPIKIEHSSVTRSVTLDNARIVLSTPSEIPIATRFRNHPPSEVISLTIWQGHVGTDDFKVSWLGRILGHTDVEDGGSEFECEPRITGLGRSGLTRNWQYGCPHLLYSQGPYRCNANKAAASTQFVVSEISGATVRLVGVNSDEGMEKYPTGLLEWQTADNRREYRTILRVADDGTVIVAGRIQEMAVGQNVILAKGCNHLTDDCETLHNNLPNYGGQDKIPTVNPLGIKNIHY